MTRPETQDTTAGSSRLGLPGDVARRRTVVAVTLVVGTGLLGLAFHARTNSPEFYGCAFAVAVVWIAGALLSGPVPVLSRGPSFAGGRGVATAAGLGVALYACFVAIDLVAREIPLVDDALDRILAHADRGPIAVILLLAAVNAVAEELFFRGALYAAAPRDRAVEWTWLVYVLVTVATANPALVVAAAVLGLVTALERRAAGGVCAPIVTHLVWSVLVITALPR
jgi:CAAX protease family protein